MCVCTQDRALEDEDEEEEEEGSEGARGFELRGCGERGGSGRVSLSFASEGRQKDTTVSVTA